VNLGAPANSSADDFCPTPVPDGRLFFVSSRPGGCGGPDMYVTSPAGGAWAEPKNLGCQANSPGPEFSPSLVEIGQNDTVLFFSSARPGGFAADPEGVVPDHDIYYSRALPDGSFGPAILVDGVNSAVDDARPNVRSDGLELVFDSVRPGGQGASDIWVSSRASVKSAWSAPVNPGAPINSAAGESRASLSRNGERLYFGSARPGGDGGSDVYLATRDGSIAGTATSTGGIAPPNTGDGGLAGSGAKTIPAGVGLLLLTFAAALPAAAHLVRR
jgi:Tol biopolymer transport system component